MKTVERFFSRHRFLLQSVVTLMCFAWFALLAGCGDIEKLLNKDKTPQLRSSLGDYNTAVGSAVTSSKSFLQANQKWESSNINNLSAAQVRQMADDFVNNGGQLSSALNNMNSVAASVQSNTRTADGTVDSGGVAPGSPFAGAGDTAVSLLPGIKGVGPGLANNVAQVIQGAKDGAKGCDALFDSDPNAYKDCIDKLRKQQTLKAAGLGFSAVMGTGAAIIVGGAAAAATAPAAVVIGGAALAGAIVGKTVSWLWNKCSSSGNRVGMGRYNAYTGETCSMSAGESSPGQMIPNTMTGGGTLVISIPGYVPVVIENFTPPADGRQLTLDFTPVPIDQADKNAQVTINWQDIAPKASSCSDIISVTGSPSPADPGPGQGVTVTATVFPVISGCTISFSMNGTDGYTQSGDYASDGSGKASFSIPGGAADVHDYVGITTNGFSYSVTYTF